MTPLSFNDALKKRIQDSLATFSAETHANPDMRQAAVAITLVNVGTPTPVYNINFEDVNYSDAAIILTRRSLKLRKHAGQWALPGGRIDPGETPEQTALRELEEEVGLALGPEHILGRLDDFTTRSGFTMKCIVVWGGTDPKLVANPDEVHKIYRIPLAEFMRDDAPMLEPIPESEHPVLMMPVGSSWIAAPTAALLYQFREVAILGKPTRVAHFEQPYFAWK